MKKMSDILIPEKPAKTGRLRYDNIVIGSSLSALLFAFSNRYPILFTEPDYPFRFDHLDVGRDLSCIKIPQQQRVLATHSGEFTVGCPKYLLWERLMFLLTLEGLVPLSNLCCSVREVGNRIICSNDYSKIAEIEFGTCHYFGDRSAHGFVTEKKLAEEEYVCYDWVAFNRGGKHKIDHIKTDDNLTNEVWFYSSDRIDGATPVKDACVVSILNTTQIDSFDFSETMARFKLISEMEDRGMKGVFNGLGPNGKPKYYKFKTSSMYREKLRAPSALTPMTQYIKIEKGAEDQLIRGLNEVSVSYDKFLRWL
tara:strand:+ start:1365 stop:2294 length:930 start_codon:yes stop_codon:yes gene_type:complete